MSDREGKMSVKINGIYQVRRFRKLPHMASVYSRRQSLPLCFLKNANLLQDHTTWDSVQRKCFFLFVVVWKWDLFLVWSQVVPTTQTHKHADTHTDTDTQAHTSTHRDPCPDHKRCAVFFYFKKYLTNITEGKSIDNIRQNEFLIP